MTTAKRAALLTAALLVLGSGAASLGLSGCRSRAAIERSMAQYDSYRDQGIAWFEDAEKLPLRTETKRELLKLKHIFEGRVTVLGLYYGLPQPRERKIRRELAETHEFAVTARELVLAEAPVPELPPPYWR